MIPSRLPDGQHLGLVRLADVVRWLMKSRRLPFESVALDLHGVLAGLEGLVLYLAPHGLSARAVGASDTFGLDKHQQGRRVLSAGIGVPCSPAVSRQSLPDGVVPGVSAALYVVQHGWGSGKNTESILDREDLAASWLAMPCEQAAALWGGVTMAQEARPLSWVDLVAICHADKRSRWTPAMVAALRVEGAKRFGQLGYKKAMAKDLSRSIQCVDGHLTKEPKRKPPSPFPVAATSIRGGKG